MYASSPASSAETTKNRPTASLRLPPPLTGGRPCNSGNDSCREDTVPAEREEHAAGLGAGLGELALRARVGDDAGAGTEAQRIALQLGAADQDVEVEVAVAVEPAHGAGVGAAADTLQLGDDLHAAHLGAAGDGPAREHRGDHLARGRVRAQPAAHVADDVVHLGVAFHRHQLVDLDAARLADPAQVVALQVHQHHVL